MSLPVKAFIDRDLSLRCHEIAFIAPKGSIKFIEGEEGEGDGCTILVGSRKVRSLLESLLAQVPE